MLRGLIVKQAFFALDLLLMAAIGLVVVFTVYRFMDSGRTGFDKITVEAPADSVESIAKLKDRIAYDVISANRLFGEAGQRSKDTIEVIEEETGPELTNLPLALKGCTSIGATNPLSSATIENGRAAKPEDRTRVYFVGQEIMAGVKLAEVHKRYVVIVAGNRKQYLTMDNKDQFSLQVAGAAKQPLQEATPAPGEVTLDKNALMTNLIEDDNLRTVFESVKEVTDGSGNVIGLTADGIGQLEIAGTLGFQDGDVAQEINGQKISSKADLNRLLQQFANVDTFRIGVLRNGRPQTIKFRVE